MVSVNTVKSFEWSWVRQPVNLEVNVKTLRVGQLILRKDATPSERGDIPGVNVVKLFYGQILQILVIS